jgi:hypothetical protein
MSADERESEAPAVTRTPTRPRADEVVAVFTGESLLFGAAGRPDLLGPEHTHDRVHHQHASVRRLADELPVRTGAGLPGSVA